MQVVLATLNAKYIHSSLALRYLKAYASKDFPDIEIREYTIKDPPNKVVADLYRRKPDVIGFSVYIWNVRETLPMLTMLRKLLPQTQFILGGPEVSYDSREWMKQHPEIDCIVQGEGEDTFLDLLKTIEGVGALADVPGIVYHAEGKIHSNPPRAKLELSKVPSPYQDEKDIVSLRDRVVYYETSRGCPFSCQFCLSSIESGVRYFPLERVKQELQQLIDAGVRTVKFVDRTFNLHRRYALELFQYLIDHRAETVFQFEITGDILPQEIVDFLATHAPAGLFRFELGVQSTNDLTNSLVQRRQNFAKLSATIRALKAGGKIVQHLDLIAGLPEEGYDSFKKTFNDVFAFEPDELQLGFLKMLRGTGMRLRAADFGYVYMDDAPYEIFSNNVLSYDEVLNIKQVEDVLEKYWNEGKLRHTIQYLTRHVFPTPFDLFQDFGAYWEENGWDTIGHQLEHLFLRLEDFLRMRYEPSVLLPARSHMIYDFLLQHRIRPHKVWWERGMHKAHRLDAIQLFTRHPGVLGEKFQEQGLAQEELEKHTVIERLPYWIHPDDPDLPPHAQPAWLVAYYPPGMRKGTRPRMFVAPVSQAHDAHHVPGQANAP